MFKDKKIKRITTILIVLLVAGGIGGLAYWYNAQKTVYTDKAEISAPEVGLSPDAPGALEEVMVKTGDYVAEDAPIARVGDELIKAKEAGIITGISNDIGKNFNPGEAVATMVYPEEMRLVGHIDEDKGLEDIKLGQRVIFTVDAFGSKQYVGTVDEISQTSDVSGVVFNISDKREVKQFDVKVRFDVNAYPELKDGMSAKMWIYKN